MSSRSLVLLFVFILTSLRCNDEPIVFKEGFIKGCALSSFQNGGALYGESNWTWFEKQEARFNAKTIAPFHPVPTITYDQRVGSACQFFDRIFDDIALLKELGCNSLRFSVEWADIEPEEGEFNEDAFAFYERLIDALLENDIMPMVTLHHFVHPLWFENMGGFTQEENLPYFVRYCMNVFERFGDRVPFWCTINEPTVLGACGYVLGIHPPGKVFHFNTAGIVLRNLLQAHVNVYYALKNMPHGDEAQIGIVHQMLEFEPYEHSVNLWFKQFRFANPLSIVAARLFNFAFGHSITKRFLKTGEFEYRAPLLGINHYRYCPEAPKSYDFIGLNFYSKVIINPSPTCYSDQVMTDMEYAIRPEAFYEALHEMAELNVPIYITENGIPDAQDLYRKDFILSYLGKVHQAIQEGVDIRGYYYWTLMDNYEWNEGYTQKFGLYEVDYETQERTLREGAKTYRDLIRVVAS